MTILLFLLSLLPVQQPARTELGTISGQIRDPRGTPTPGVRVFAIPVEADAVDTLISIAQTDSDGRYRLEGVPPGRYRIAAGLLDSPNYYPGVATRSQGQILTIAAGQALTNLDFAVTFPKLPPQLWGRVEFDDGSPLPVGTLQGVRLILSSDTGYRTTQPFTNQQGFFFFQSVVPGEFVFTLAPLPLGFGYMKSMTFGNVDLTRAPLTLTEAENTTEIKVVLTKTRPAGMPPGVRVSGHVNRRAPLVLFAVTRVNPAYPGELINPVANITPKEDGSFEVEGVPPGRYELRAPRAGKGAVTLDVAGNDVTRLELDFSLGEFLLSSTSMQSITGIVELANGSVPTFELGFSTTRAPQAATHTALISGKEFGINLPEGEYRVNVSGLPNGYSVESVTVGPLDLTYPFLVTNKGIADRFTGTPVLIRSAGPAPATRAGITVRLKAPPSEK